jgi:beta-lactamase class A
MIEQSDNTAAYVVGKRLGLDSVEQNARSWGLTHTSLSDNLTSAGDVAILLSRLVNRDLLPEQQTQEILRLLQNTVWTDRLQSGVPPSVAVAHKIGTDVGVYNDAAVFLNGNRPYLVVVLSTGTDETGALDTMEALSRMVYQFEGGLPAATRIVKR